MFDLEIILKRFYLQIVTYKHIFLLNVIPYETAYLDLLLSDSCVADWSLNKLFLLLCQSILKSQNLELFVSFTRDLKRYIFLDRDD